jgi:choline-phosphate cytidylyltransferase
MSRTTVYIDGVFDMFHIGHIRALQKAKQIRPDVELVVGIISDEDATGYKRKPIYDENARFEIISNLRIVDRIIFPAPLIVTKEFVANQSIDLVVHGFSDMKDLEKQRVFFAEIIDMFETIPYYPYVSTSHYLEKIRSNSKSDEADEPDEPNK